LKALGIEVRDVVPPRRAARVDSSMRVAVGHDLFYFADAAARARFVKDPLRYCRRLTDPVTLRRFRPTRRSPKLEYQGRSYWFAGDSTFAAFQATPDSFAVRRGM
jgi:YHS domain-containing protein